MANSWRILSFLQPFSVEGQTGEIGHGGRVGPRQRRGSRLRLGWMGAIATLVTTVVTTLATTGPGQGEIIPVGFDGLEVAPLSADDQTRLEVLLGVRQIEILSPPSPDGTTLVVAVSSRHDQGGRSLYFLNLETGELSEARVLENELVAPDLPLRWVDNDTLRFVQQDVYGPWEIITVNRVTEIASRTRVYPIQAEGGEILGIAPDFSKFALRVYGEDDDTIYIVFLPSLRRLEVARLPEDLQIQPPSWSADGDRVVLVTAAGEERRLFDRTPSSPSLADPLVQDALGTLAPEENPFYQHSALRVFDFTEAEPQRLELLAPDLGGDTFGGAQISPDGQRVLIKRYRPSVFSGRSHPSYVFPALAYFEVIDLQGTVLDTIDAQPLQGPEESDGWFLGNDRLLLWSTDGLNRPLHVYDLALRQLTTLPLPPGAVDPLAVTASEDGATVVYGLSSVTQPPELYALDLEGDGEPRSLTSINAAVADRNRVQMHPVNFTTSQGERSGFLIQPMGSAFPPVEQPIVFWQQGGPGGSMVNEFATEVEMPLNLLPNFGLPVLVVPLSGREGFGPDRYLALAGDQNFGQVDVLEGAEILGQLIQRGWTTAGQVGVTGCSYGGYYAAQMMAQFPQLVAAANPQCSLLDLLTEWQLGYSSLLSYLVGQTPMVAPATYLQASPLYNVGAVRTPTLLFHGADDFLQIDMARNFHDVLDLAEVPVTLYEFEGVGHSLYGSGYQPLAAQLQIEFFRQYLQP